MNLNTESFATPVSLKLKASYDNKTFLDALGRNITLREPTWRDQYILFSAMGDDSSNPGCVSAAMPMLYISKIDEAVMTLPTNKNELMANLTLMGKEGVEVVAKNVVSESTERGEDDIKK